MTDPGDRAATNESLAEENAADDDLDEVERGWAPDGIATQDEETTTDEDLATDDEKVDEAGRESFPASDPPAIP